MCLNLIGSQFKNINEVEHLLYNEYHPISETKLLQIKDNREEIENQLEIINSMEFLEEMGL